MALLWPMLRMAAANWRNVAVVDDRRRYTYREIIGGGFFMADHIEQATAKQHIGILLPTSGAFPIALLGTWLARRVAVPFNYLLTPDELAYVIADSGVDTVITAKPMLEFLGGTDKLPPHIKLVCMEDLDFTGVPPLRWPPVLSDDELAVILYTSGTSAKPKGVMLTHGNLHSNVEAGIVHAGITQAQTFLGVLPQFHSFGLTAMTLIPLRGGCKVVYAARFNPRQIVELLRQHRPALFMAIPSMYSALLALKDAEAQDFASVRMAVSGGEPLPNAVYEAFLDRFNVRLLEGYGLTETSPVLNWCTPDAAKRFSVGRALPGVDIAILDENGRILGLEEDGEIVVAGPNVMRGYYNLPQQTQDAFVNLPRSTTAHHDGAATTTKRFFRTGDIGKLDADGFLYITGRKKEMLKVGGEIVVPREVEEALALHPSVRDAAVIGQRDDLRGEIPIAFVELNEGHEFNQAALRDWCRQRLAGFKVPREIHRLDALPRNPTGKILRRQLASILAMRD